MEMKDKVIYQLFLTDFTKEGTFEAASEKLGYLSSLGIDVIQLMPFYLMGEKDKKGSLGSPYAIKDYLKIEPRFGGIEDCRSFINKAHSLGMKVIFDVVFHHTSRDCPLLLSHPDWYYRNSSGNFGNFVGDWDDIYDLDLSNEELLNYLLDVLKTYVGWGTDGFRFDVASLISLKLYKMMREELDPLKKDLIYLGESVDASFTNFIRRNGGVAYSNEELFSSGLDLLYHYASWGSLKNFLESKKVGYLENYKVALRLEAASINNEGLIVRAIENHDNKRIASYSDDISFIKSLLAYSFFSKGPAFIYNGEEYGERVTPDFFEKEPLSYKENKEISSFVKKLIKIKHSSFFSSLYSSLPLYYDGPILVIEDMFKDGKALGLFNLSEGAYHFTPHPEEVGEYFDLLSSKNISLTPEGIEIKEPMYLEKRAQK